MNNLQDKFHLPKIALLLVVLVTAFSFDSCKTKKHQAANANQPATTNSNCKIDRRAPDPLIADMRKSEFQYNWFSGKMDCDATLDSSKYSFNVTVRMKKDSAIWMLITDPVIGIKVARVLITCDSVKMVVYLPSEKCFKGDFAFLSQLLQTDVDLDMMQSLLVGNSVSFYEEDEKLKSSINMDECNYTLSTIRKRKLQRALNNPGPPSDPFQTISIEPVTFKILKILFIDAANRTFTSDYSDFQKVDSMSFPNHAIFYARGVQKSARLEVDYKHVSLNGPLEFPFSFPEDCQPLLNDDQQQPH